MPRVWHRPPHDQPHVRVSGSLNAAHKGRPLAEPTPGRHLSLRAISIRGTAGDPIGPAGTPATPGASTIGSSHSYLLTWEPTGIFWQQQQQAHWEAWARVTRHMRGKMGELTQIWFRKWLNNYQPKRVNIWAISIPPNSWQLSFKGWTRLLFDVEALHTDWFIFYSYSGNEILFQCVILITQLNLLNLLPSYIPIQNFDTIPSLYFVVQLLSKFRN